MTDDLRLPPLLIGAREAARALSICQKTLWTLTKCGDIQCLRIGRRVLYDPAYLRAWIDSKKGGDDGQVTD